MAQHTTHLPASGLPPRAPGGPVRLLDNHRLWQAVLLAMMVPLAFVAFWPTPVDAPVGNELQDFLRRLHRHGIPRWVNYRFVEMSANVALFVPLGFVAALAFFRKRWWQGGLVGLLLSCCIELGQLLFLQDRFASPIDLMTNTSGAVIGALIATAALKIKQARRLAAADL